MNRNSGIFDIWKREVGDLSTRNFADRRAASENLVLRLNIQQKLDKHRGCVNTASFNAAGDILISGSNDRRVIFWNWETGRPKLAFDSGHDVFEAKIIPDTEDRSIVTRAADFQVRHGQIRESSVLIKLLTRRNRGRVYNFAIEPGCPHVLYTCGEAGLVQHVDLRSGTADSLFRCKPAPKQSHFCPPPRLNAITIDPINPNLFAVGGADQFARLYDIRRYRWDGSSEFGQPVDFFCPTQLINDKDVEITGLSFSVQRELLVSYVNDSIYLFTMDIGLGTNPTFSSLVSSSSDGGDMTSDYCSGMFLSNVDGNGKAAPQAYRGNWNRSCIGFFGPKCDYVVSGSDHGEIFIWKKKGGELVRCWKADLEVVNCIASHPHDAVLASSGFEHDIKIWTPCIDRATPPTNNQRGGGDEGNEALARWAMFLNSMDGVINA